MLATITQTSVRIEMSRRNNSNSFSLDDNTWNDYNVEKRRGAKISCHVIKGKCSGKATVTLDHLSMLYIVGLFRIEQRECASFFTRPWRIHLKKVKLFMTRRSFFQVKKYFGEFCDFVHFFYWMENILWKASNGCLLFHFHLLFIVRRERDGRRSEESRRWRNASWISNRPA